MSIQPGSIFVIGDSHIGLSRGDEKRMVDWLDRLEALRPRSLYLNGDLFHYFIGEKSFMTESVRNFFSRLRKLRDAGTDVHYVEGNRDFFLGGSLAEESVSTISLESTIAAGPRRYVVVHGDMINDRDIPYRFWRRASKNPVTRFGVKLIPGPLARRFVHNVEKKLARSNFKHKTRLPFELMKAYGEKRRAEGFDVVVFGHFHHKTILQSEGSTVAVLPPWFESGEAMVIDPNTGDFGFEVI